MQAVLTVAGKSSRMYPFGGNLHKAGVSLLDKPLIVYTLEALIKNGVDNVVIVESAGNGIKEVVSRAKLPELKITYVQHDGARGMGEAILDAKAHLEKQFLLVHAHHIDAIDILPDFLSRIGNENAVLVQKTSDISGYGGVELDGDRIISLEEKPTETKKYSFRIVGFYFLNEKFLTTLEKVEKQHYSFEDALSVCAKEDIVRAVETAQEVVTLKYPWHLLALNDYLLKRIKRSISKNASIAENAQLEGEVIVEDGVKIESGAVIKGPAYLGKNAYVGTNAILRNGVSLERDVVVGANMEVKRSVIMQGTTTHSGYIGDSVIGASCKIAAFFCTGNVRIDRKNVQASVKGEKVDTGLKSAGAFIGHGTKVGIRVSTMPGVLIGENVTIGPSTTVFNNILSDVKYYTKITEIVTRPNADTLSPTSNEVKKVVLFDIDYTLFDTKVFKDSQLKTFSVYEEVTEVLGEIGAYAELGIFSEGEDEFQKAKLLETAIESHFPKEHVHVVKKKNESVAMILDAYKDKTLFLVDDKLEVLFLAKKHNPNIYTVWIKRGPFALSQVPLDDFSPDATVEDLRMVLPIVVGI